MPFTFMHRSMFRTLFEVVITINTDLDRVSVFREVINATADYLRMMSVNSRPSSNLFYVSRNRGWVPVRNQSFVEGIQLTYLFGGKLKIKYIRVGDDPLLVR